MLSGDIPFEMLNIQIGQNTFQHHLKLLFKSQKYFRILLYYIYVGYSGRYKSQKIYFKGTIIITIHEIFTFSWRSFAEQL